jgi:arginase family enzyme
VSGRATAVVFPFDLFGSGGAAAGAQLAGDELREILADNRRETVPTRADAYSPHVRIKEVQLATMEDLTAWRQTGRKLARASLAAGDFLLWLTGNHLGALPVYDELSRLEGAMALQLDAHLDIHNFHDTSTAPSHGNFLLHVDGPICPVVNVGHRDLLLPAEYIQRHYRQTISAAHLHSSPDSALAKVRASCQGASRLFLDLDCDVFDPAVFPGVSRPVPFGLSAGQALAVLEAVGPERLSGVIVSELDPGRDEEDRSLSVLMWLLEWLLLKRYEGRVAGGGGNP